MTTLTFDVDPDQFNDALVAELQQAYIDCVTAECELGIPNIEDSILTVLQYYMIGTEFEAWYETIKEL